MDWKTARASKFPDEVLHLAQQSERDTGVPACLTLAQWAVESNDGSRMIGKANPFGIKWHSACGFPAITVATHEWLNGVRTEVDAQFIDFPDLASAFDYHGRLLTNPNGPYGKCQAVRNVWAAFVACVCGIYATDPHYRETILGVINTYHLQDFNLPKGA